MTFRLKAQGLYEVNNEHDACGIGAVVNINGKAEHKLIDYAKEILINLSHRGAAGADEITGDGAGILFQIPHEFFVQEANKVGIELPKPTNYGVGMVFGPKDEQLRLKCEKSLEKAIGYYGMKVLGWRDVRCSSDCLGQIALTAEPCIRQVFINSCGLEESLFERRLYMARKRAENVVRSVFGEKGSDFYVTSLSSKTICYKGMFMAHQLFTYYPDLADERVKSALAIVHQRYSTNTFPNWQLAQPFHCIAHNGEINTLSGNRNRIRAREMKMSSELFGDDIKDLFPVLSPQGSDSACFDNVLELLVHSGRSMPHSMMMMVPEAFGERYHISTDKRAFYEYHSAVMEPWDGPAAIVFTDGRVVGGTLDRNGLRPCRYVVTEDGLVVMASEIGVVEFPPEKIHSKGRLRPGHMFLVDTVEGRIVSDNEIKSKIARQKPYRRWLDENKIELRGLFDSTKVTPEPADILNAKLRTFGYTSEELKNILMPMALNAQEPIGSMGNDAALAVLSDKPRSLFNYFKQRFAQVTNPPIDPLRERLVMSLMLFVGKRRNLLAETPEHCRQLKLPHPVLTNEDIERLRTAKKSDFKVSTVSAVFDALSDNPEESLRKALVDLVNEAEKAARAGASIIIISDKKFSSEYAPIPALLATSAVHHNLLEHKLRAEAGIIVETGEAREVMHFCLLCGYGANAVNAYLAFDTLGHLQRTGDIPDDIEPEKLVDNFIAAIKKGILKTMSKMGISTLRSYRAAQLFEAIGLDKGFVESYFSGTSSSIGGIGLGEIAVEAIKRHKKAYGQKDPAALELEYGGDYHYRTDGEKHLWNPTTVSKLQQAVINNDQTAYNDYAEQINNQSRKLCTLRGMFDFVEKSPIEIEEVEPAFQIVKRFCTGAMSHGSISKEAHECMAIAMNRLGGMSNTGEGGEETSRYKPEPNGDSKNCAIKQVASGRFGVTINYLANGKEIQIKMAQGAKPGEGGQLPGHKVTEEIAKLRYSTPSVTLISPPPHHDIYSIEDLAQLIYDLKCSNPEAKVSVKLVSEIGVGTIAAGVAKGNADEVLISGYDGGTGASPLSSIKHAGTPWELGLAETQQVLVLNGLRDRIRVQTDGQLRTGRDVVIAAMLGAEQFGFGTAALVSLGCVLVRKCHIGTCPAGIASQDPELRCRFAGQPEHLQRFMLFVAEEIRGIMAQLGFREFEEMVGRVECLETKKAVNHWKARGLDFSAIFHKPKVLDEKAIRLTRKQPGKLRGHLDWEIIKKLRSAIDNQEKTKLEMPIHNVNRTIGTILSNEIVKKYGPRGLNAGTIELVFKGSAGQSFGAFCIKGVTLKIIGDCNDYVGKGLSGGRIIVQTPPDSPFNAHENIIVGNTLLYGATSGEVFINGVAGERFGIRNSGVTAVVEGIGDHGCEYMTGGVAVVLGQTGRNFAAGMSGGIAYVFDEMQLFDTLCNLDTVDLESVWKEEDKDKLYNLIQLHYDYTESTRAKQMLDNWPNIVGKFVKVIPIDYRRALERLKNQEQRETETTPATEEVFHG